jgi:hypothetical protein
MARGKTTLVKAAPGKASTAIGDAVDNAGDALDKVPPPSPNPMTNILLADIALRGGGQILRHAVERLVLGVKYSPEKAKDIVKGRSMAQTLISTAIARLATRSVPGAIIVGGGMLAKTLYDRSQDKRAVERKGEKQVDEQAANA